MSKKTQVVKFASEETRKRHFLVAALWGENDSRSHELLRRCWDDDYSKLLLLCQHYGIRSSPSMFYELALALARELYPEAKKRGRKSKWTTLNQGALVVEIERIVEPNDTAHGVAWAANQLAKREPWKSFLEMKDSDDTNPNPAEALRKVYYNFKTDKWAKVMRDAFGWHQQTNTIDAWEMKVADFVKNPNLK